MLSRLSGNTWIAKVHLTAHEGESPFPEQSAIGAYTNCITEARDETEFQGKVRALLGQEGFEVTEFEGAERLSDRIAAAVTPDDKSALDEILDLIAETDLEHEVCTTEIHTYSAGYGLN
jgi:hypothetical protein